MPTEPEKSREIEESKESLGASYSDTNSGLPDPPDGDSDDDDDDMMMRVLRKKILHKRERDVSESPLLC